MDTFEIFKLLFPPVFILFLLFFIIVIIKKILFWLYLWQLKEYHIGRFLAHFSTAKGKELLLNKVNIFKIFFIIVLIYPNLIVRFIATFINISIHTYLISFIYIIEGLFGIFFIYLLEGLNFLKNFLWKTIKKPIFTKKIIFIFLITLFIASIFLFFILQTGILLTFLIFDLLIPLIVSAMVLFFQPLAVLGRNWIIKKAKKKRSKFKDLLVIGITGSYGKTSTKEFLAAILSEKFNVLKTKEHQNSEIGISQCIINDLKPEHQIFVCEMGAYNRGGIKLLCDVVKPKIGVITGINEQHMATFGSLENIIKAKYELIESLPPDGVAFFNGKNKYCLELFQKTKIPKKIYYNTFSTAVENVLPKYLWAENIEMEKEWLSFKVVSSDGDAADFKLNLLGAQNVLNILGAAAVAKELGVSLKEISKASEKIKEEQGGMKLIKTRDGLNIIDATYSANPDGVISHLEYLKIWPGRKVIIMLCLIELGPVSKEVHKRIGKKIGEVCSLAIITTKDRFKELKEGFIEGGGKEGNILFIENPKIIFKKLKNFCQTNDVILLESRAPSQLISLLVY